MAVCWQNPARQNSSSWGWVKGMTQGSSLSRCHAQAEAPKGALNITLWFRGALNWSWCWEEGKQTDLCQKILQSGEQGEPPRSRSGLWDVSAAPLISVPGLSVSQFRKNLGSELSSERKDTSFDGPFIPSPP